MSIAAVRFRMQRSGAGLQRDLSIDAAPGVVLAGHLVVPADVRLRGVIAFPHASREPCLDVYNRVAARTLRDAGFAVFLFDVMTPGEKVGRALPIDLPTVAKRIVAVTESLRSEPETANLAVGYIATGAGAPGALSAASTLPDDVQAVVALGARPELLEVSLERITAPVLLVVGGTAADFECGHEVRNRLACQHEIVIVPGSHKLTEGDPRPFGRALRFATQWFGMYLGEPSVGPQSSRADEVAASEQPQRAHGGGDPDGHHHNRTDGIERLRGHQPYVRERS